MNRTVLGLVLGFALVASNASRVTAQSGSAGLQGAWTIQEITTPQPSTPPRNKPTGLIQFSGRHYSTVAINDGMRPALPEGGAAKATADQLRATWGPVVANAGTFTVSGNIIRQTTVIAKAPVVAGNFAEWSFTLTGDNLVMTQVRNQSGPAENPITLRLKRTK
jgi:hypothetical protein